MLTCLRVRRFAIIDELEVEFGSGFNVVTGETGAGKSILVDALELVLGGRGRPEVVRTGYEDAEVEALFDISDDPTVRARLEASGIEGTEDEVLIRRVIQQSGRTRAYVNGRLTTATQLSEIASGLTDISSQHEHHSLVDPATHLEYLDAFARLAPMRDEMARAYAALSVAAAARVELSEKEKGRAEREDLLRFQLHEIEELSPEEREEEALAEEKERLRHATRLCTVAAGGEETLYSRDAALCDELSKLGSSLSEAAAIDPALRDVANLVDAARAQLEEAARELGRYARGITVNPERLAEVEERLDRLGRLKRKHGGSIQAILAYRDQAKAELLALDHYAETMNALDRDYERAKAEAASIARKLSERRRKTASKLARAISEELGSLGMGDAEIRVQVGALTGPAGELEIDGARVSPAGIDRAEFLIAPNRGEEARPLRKVASGGELSRAMLAIKRVLAGLGPAGTYVFDEVDSGIGGAVAEVIGRKICDVAKHHQVICITHLPQIAVFADTHFRVRKEVVAGRTRSDVQRLDKHEDALDEVARMLGGLKVTPKTKAAAAEMMKEAQAAK